MTDEEIKLMLKDIIDNGAEYEWSIQKYSDDPWHIYKLGNEIHFTNNPIPTIQEEIIAFKLKNEELKKALDSYKALDSHYDEIEEDAKRIAKENEELKTQNKDLCESLDIMNNRESELLEQIEKMKNRLNCTKYHYCLCKDKNCKNCKDWKLEE